MLEIVLFIAGIWILFSGKVPGWIVGKKDFVITGNKARLVGFILSLPFPISLVSGFILGFLFGMRGASYAFFVEIAVFIIDLIIALIFIRKFRTPALTTVAQ